MDAQTGIQFLKLLLLDQKYPMDISDIEEAIKIADLKSPSAAFDAALRHYVARHGDDVNKGYLAFAKGTRWLAIIRRNEGRQAFDTAADELR